MGRIIKFRAKAMSEEAWVYGDLIHYTRPRCEKVCIQETDGFQLMHDVVEETVCQFTGLYDKNCKEIYEGDIVRHTFGKRKDDTGKFVDEYRDIVVVYDYGSFNVSCLSLCLDYVEVLGNIYDNPELINH